MVAQAEGSSTQGSLSEMSGSSTAAAAFLAADLPVPSANWTFFPDWEGPAGGLLGCACYLRTSSRSSSICFLRRSTSSLLRNSELRSSGCSRKQVLAACPDRPQCVQSLPLGVGAPLDPGALDGRGWDLGGSTAAAAAAEGGSAEAAAAAGDFSLGLEMS